VKAQFIIIPCFYRILCRLC